MTTLSPIAVAMDSMSKEQRQLFFSVRINSEPQSLSVTLLVPGSARGSAVAEACRFGMDKDFGPGTWYLNRVLVQDPEARGHGVGTYVLSLLQATLRLRPDCETLLVEPGGYSNKIAAQRRFYRRAGFVKKLRADNLYVWKAK